MEKKPQKSKLKELPEEERKHLRERSNKLISRYCNYAALVIVLVALAAFVVGKADLFFGQVGLMIAIALLAIAAINDPSRK